MQHRIPTETLGPRGTAMADAVRACVHCGFCLPTCPTYVTLGEEMDSPRGRILLMKEVLEGALDAEQAAPYIDRCLGCQACVTSCPSGVAYGDLLSGYRAHTEPSRQRGPGGAARRLLLASLARPRRLARLLRVARWIPARDRLTKALATSRLARLLPPSLIAALALAPESPPERQPIAERYAPEGRPRSRVALLRGCAQEVLAPTITRAAIRVLVRNGVEILAPRTQGCCGALAIHGGLEAEAKQLARRNLSAFDLEVDALLTTAAGCGSGIHEYPLLFAGDPEAAGARRLAEKTRDITDFLADLGIEPPPALAAPVRIAYHDACHLAHAQGVRHAPRALLAAIPGVTLVEPAEQALCCGSAGIYNLEQTAIADQLGARKARNLAAAETSIVAAGNVGCAVQIARHLASIGAPQPVLHPVEILDRAYRGQDLVRLER